MNLLHKKTFPTIATERLLLRKPTLRDAATYHQILSCPEISRYSDLPFEPTKTRSKQFVSWMGKLHARGSGVGWLICMEDASTVIGSIRINSIEKKAMCGVLGYELHPNYWNRGYLTEALMVVVDHAHNDLTLNRLEAWTNEDNEASERVLIKNGFQFEGMQREKVCVRDQFQNIRLFGHLASDAVSE